MTTRVMLAVATLLLIASIGSAKEHLFIRGRQRKLNANQALSWTAKPEERSFVLAERAPTKSSMNKSKNGSVTSKMKSSKPNKSKMKSTEASKHSKHSKSTKHSTTASKSHRPEPPPPPPEECEPIEHESCDPTIMADTCDIHTSCGAACIPTFCKLPHFNPHKIRGAPTPDDRYVKLGSVCGYFHYVEGFPAGRHDVEVCCEVDEKLLDRQHAHDDNELAQCVGCGACATPQRVSDVCCRIALGARLDDAPLDRMGVEEETRLGRDGNYGQHCPGDCCKCAPGDGPESYRCIGKNEVCSIRTCDDDELTTFETTSSTMEAMTTTAATTSESTTLTVEETTDNPATTSEATSTTTKATTTTTTNEASSTTATATGGAIGACPISPFNYVLVGDTNVFGGAGTDADSPRTACIDSNTTSGFQQNNVNLLNALANFDDEACLELGDRVLVDIRYTAFFDQDGNPFTPTLASEYAAGLKNALSPMTEINPTSIRTVDLTSPGALDAYKTVIFYSPVGIPQEEQDVLLDFMLSGGRVILIVDGFISDEAAAGLNAMIMDLWGGSAVFDTSFTNASTVSQGSTVTNMELNVMAGDLCYANGRNVVIGSSGVPVAYYSHIIQPNPGPPLIVVDSINPQQ